MKSFTAFNEMVSNKKQKEAIENAKLDRKSALKVASKTYKEDTELEEGLKQARKNVGMDPDKPSCWKGYKATGTKMKGGKQVPDCKKEEVELEEKKNCNHSKKGVECDEHGTEDCTDKVEEGTKYGLYKGSGKAGGAMKAFLDKRAKELEAKKKKQKPEYRNTPAFGDPSHHSNAKSKNEETILETPKGDVGKDTPTKQADRAARSYGTGYGAKYNAPARKTLHQMKRGVKKYKGEKENNDGSTKMTNFIDDRKSHFHRQGKSYDEPSRKKTKTESANIADILARLEKKRISKGGDPNESPLPAMKKYHADKAKKKIKESVEKEKEEADGTPSSVEEEIKMTRKAYNKLHKDFKSDDPKKPRTTKYVPGKGTVSMPVKFVDEAKVDQGRSDYGKASIRNYRRMGPGHGDPGMFDPEGKRGKTIDKRREEHKSRRGVKGAKVPAYKVSEEKKSNPYGKRAKLKMLIKGFAERNRMNSGNVAKEGMYDVDPKTGESPVATSVRKGNKLKGDKRLKHFAKLSKKMIGEEGYDRMRDAALEKGTWKGGGGQPSIARQSRMKGKTPLQKEAEKKYGKGATALDIVKKEIIKKHGKGAIMDVKKK